MIKKEQLKTIIRDFHFCDDFDVRLYYPGKNKQHFLNTYSKKAFLRNVYRLSKEEHIKGLGVVHNDVKMEKNGYGYGYYEEDKK